MAAGSYPEEVGGYRLLTPIGRGGMGTVFAAQREIVEGVTRLFAVKAVHHGLEGNFGDELMAEAQLAARVRHPNVVQVVETIEGPGGFYLIMEYVEGSTLSSLLRHAHRSGEPIPLPLIARVMRDALLGLGAAHDACTADGQPLGMVHRDFSPQNILIGADGVTRLTDFGIAKAHSRRSETATGVVKGKIGYMAPEQARGLPLDRRCDLWAAGVVLWESLTSRRLFDAENDAAILLDLVSGADPPSPSSFRAGIPPAVDALLAKLLVRQPADRLPDASQAVAELDAAFAEVGIADDATVRDHVREVEGEALEEVARAIRRATMTSPTYRTTGTTELTATLAPTDAQTDTAVMTPVAGLAKVERAPRWPWLAVAAAAIALAGWGLGRPTPVTLSGGWAVPSMSLPATSAPLAPFVTVNADAPIAQLRVGDEAPIVLPKPTRRMQLPRPERAQRLWAQTADGRSAEVELALDADRVSLTFGATPPPSTTAPAPRPPRPRPAPPPPPKDDDLLAPTP